MEWQVASQHHSLTIVLVAVNNPGVLYLNSNQRYHDNWVSLANRI